MAYRCIGERGLDVLAPNDAVENSIQNSIVPLTEMYNKPNFVIRDSRARIVPPLCTLYLYRCSLVIPEAKASSSQAFDQGFADLYAACSSEPSLAYGNHRLVVLADLAPA